MRISGQVIGAPTTTATRRSVILSAEGSEARLTFAWTTFAAACAAASPPSAIAPAALIPSVLKKDRRPTAGGTSSSILRTAGFMPSLLVSFAGEREDGRKGEIHLCLPSSHAPFLLFFLSEVELQRELHRPVIDDRGGDAAGGRRVEVLVGEAEAGMVEQVERVPT